LTHYGEGNNFLHSVVTSDEKWAQNQVEKHVMEASATLFCKEIQDTTITRINAQDNQPFIT
jgi:hypothetical protein